LMYLLSAWCGKVWMGRCLATRARRSATAERLDALPSDVPVAEENEDGKAEVPSVAVVNAAMRTFQDDNARLKGDQPLHDPSHLPSPTGINAEYAPPLPPPDLPPQSEHMASFAEFAHIVPGAGPFTNAGMMPTIPTAGVSSLHTPFATADVTGYKRRRHEYCRSTNRSRLAAPQILFGQLVSGSLWRKKRAALMSYTRASELCCRAMDTLATRRCRLQGKLSPQTWRHWLPQLARPTGPADLTCSKGGSQKWNTTLFMAMMRQLGIWRCHPTSNGPPLRFTGP
jgi:hypothetical protein